MIDVRNRTEGWVISPRLGLLVVLGLLAAVLVVRQGAHDQHSRRVPAPRSAQLEVLAGQTHSKATAVGESAAVRLAAIVNGLSQEPMGELVCPDDDGGGYRIMFATSGGTVVVAVDNGGCAAVGIESHGRDWGAGKWDPAGTLRAAVAADLRAY